MLYGPPIQLLYRAHRSGQRVGMGVHSPHFWVSLVMDKRRIVHAAGVPGLLDGLKLGEDALNGVMAHDLEVAIRRGLPTEMVLATAERNLGRFLAGLIDAPEVSAHLDPDPELPKGSFPLPHSAVHMLAEALPAVRPAERVTALYRPDRDHLVVARVPDDSYLIELDPITLRTLRLVRQPMALGDLAARSGRNQAQRTEHFWRAFDLLVQLGLLEILRSSQAQRRFVSSDEGGWERGVSRPAPVTPAGRRPAQAPAAPEPEAAESELERLGRAMDRLAEGPGPQGGGAKPAARSPQGSSSSAGASRSAGTSPQALSPSRSPSPPLAPSPPPPSPSAPSALDLGALDAGDEGPMAMFEDDEEDLDSVAQLELLDDDSEVDEEEELLEFSFGDEPEETALEFSFGEVEPDVEEPEEEALAFSFGEVEVEVEEPGAEAPSLGFSFSLDEVEPDEPDEPAMAPEDELFAFSLEDAEEEDELPDEPTNAPAKEPEALGNELFAFALEDIDEEDEPTAELTLDLGQEPAEEPEPRAFAEVAFEDVAFQWDEEEEEASASVIEDGTVVLSAADLSSPERLLRAVESAAERLREGKGAGRSSAGASLDSAGDGSAQDGPHLEIIFEEDDEDEETWPGPPARHEEPEDVGDVVSEIGPSAAEVLERAVEAPLRPVQPEEALEIATRCAEFNPLAVLRLELDQLDGVLTLEGLQRAFERERARFKPALYKSYPRESREAVQALDEILRASREAMRDPAIVAMWLRALRAFAEEREPLDAATVRRARQQFEAAQRQAYDRDWRGASLSVAEALRLWPGQPRIRLLQIFCEVAVRRITPVDGVLNIDSMWLTDPAEQALAQVTAGRLLKASGRGASAVARFRAALKLDPTREDARRELAASQQ